MVGTATGGEGSTAVISTNHETSLSGLGMVDYFLFQMLTITPSCSLQVCSLWLTIGILIIYTVCYLFTWMLPLIFDSITS